MNGLFRRFRKFIDALISCHAKVIEHVYSHRFGLASFENVEAVNDAAHHSEAQSNDAHGHHRLPPGHNSTLTSNFTMKA
jgi:hypothetical protein